MSAAISSLPAKSLETTSCTPPVCSVTTRLPCTPRSETRFLFKASIAWNATCKPPGCNRAPVLYFTKNDASLGRITTGGTVLPDIPATFSPNGNGLDAHGDDVWFTDFNNHSVWRYDITAQAFTEFPTPTAGSTPLDVAVDAEGIVWFTEGFDGHLDG